MINLVPSEALVLLPEKDIMMCWAMVLTVPCSAYPGSSLAVYLSCANLSRYWVQAMEREKDLVAGK